MRTVIALGLYVAVLAVLLVARRRLGVFSSVSAFLAATLFYLADGFDPALPGSILMLYGGAAVISVVLYITSSEAGRAAFLQPIIDIMVQPGKQMILLPLLVIIPALVGWQVYKASLPSEVAPPLIRTVHPSPPSTISITPAGSTEAVTVDIIKDENPLRHLEKSNPGEFQAKVARGKVVYYQNCFYCHGDHLAADGHYAKAMRPRPADFQDPSVLPLFTETFFFWRISKGGPGLPAGGTPWDSVMPVWENFLSADDMWSVILFLYDHTGYKPRGRESEGAK